MQRSSRKEPADYRAFPDVGARNWLQEVVEIPLAVRLLGVHSSQRVLEIGCGRGVALPVINRLCRPRHLTGLDTDVALIAQARRRLDSTAIDAGLCAGDVRVLPFAGDSFDVVIDFGTCYHIAQPELALMEIGRVLRVGGVFVHETPLSQFLAHPIRSRSRALPWSSAPMLQRFHSALLWSSRRKK